MCMTSIQFVHVCHASSVYVMHPDCILVVVVCMTTLEQSVYVRHVLLHIIMSMVSTHAKRARVCASAKLMLVRFGTLCMMSVFFCAAN